MTDVEFCVEYVSRIPRPVYTKTGRELTTIVECGIPIPVQEMFKDGDARSGIMGLFANAPVSLFVYRFVRDHQHLFIKEAACPEQHE